MTMLWLLQGVTPTPPASAVTQILLALIAQLPAILTALAAFTAAFVTIRTLKKTDTVDKKVDAVAVGVETAAAKADEAVVKADALHSTTQAIATQSDQIAAQTNSHLSHLTDLVTDLQARNAELAKTVTTLANILTAGRVAEAASAGKDTVTVPAVRPDDLTQAIQTIAEIKQAPSDPPADDQRKNDR